MTVAELIAELETHDSTAVVVMAKDAEGNNFSPLELTHRAVYVPDTTWSGQTYIAPDQLTQALRDDGFTEADVYDGPDGQQAVVLWPVN